MKYRNRLFNIFVVLGMLFILTLAMAQEKGKLPEVVIKGEKSLKLDSEKPRLDLTIEENKQILKSFDTEKEVMIKKPTGWVKQPKDSLPELSKSPQVVVPSSRHIKSNRICVFNPLRDLRALLKEAKLEKKKLVKWELLIVDDAGQPFRKYSDQKLPPEEIVFDGRDESGRVIEVGYSYSTVLLYHDIEGNTNTSVGNPFIIQGLAHQENKGFFISLNFNVLYREEPDALKKREYSKLGEELIRETSEWIKKNFFTFPVKVTVLYRNEEIAAITGREIAEELAGRLMRLKSEVTYEGRTTGKSLGRVEILIVNR